MAMKKNKKITIALAILFTSALLTGCGAEKGSTDATDESLGINAYEKDMTVNPYDTTEVNTKDEESTENETATEETVDISETMNIQSDTSDSKNSSSDGSSNSSSDSSAGSSSSSGGTTDTTSLPLIPESEITNKDEIDLGNFVIDGQEYNIREITPELLLENTETTYRFGKSLKLSTSYYFHGIAFDGNPQSPIYYMELLDNSGNVFIPENSLPTIDDNLLIKAIGYTNDLGFGDNNAKESNYEYITFCNGVEIGMERKEIEEKLGVGVEGQPEDDEHPVTIYKTSDATLVITYERVDAVIVLEGNPDKLDYAQYITLFRN